jgi:hypothetical protein
MKTTTTTRASMSPKCTPLQHDLERPGRGLGKALPECGHNRNNPYREQMALAARWVVR